VLLVNPMAAKSLDDVLDSPARYLGRGATATSRAEAELTTLALMRMASNDPDAAAGLLGDRWERLLPTDLSAWTWGVIGKQAAQKLQPNAADYFLRASTQAAKTKSDIEWPDETLGWKARAALRADSGRPRWQQVVQAINAMSAAEQREPAWLYWKARGLQALAKDSQDPESLRTLSRELLDGLIGQMNFYGALSAEDAPSRSSSGTAGAADAGRDSGRQGQSRPHASPAADRDRPAQRGRARVELHAARHGRSRSARRGQLACDREVWDRCINTSERTRAEVDMQQRFPMPFRRRCRRSRARPASTRPMSTG
jgi:soluble lytic murein transglycosylase